MTPSMERAIRETYRRREKQEKYNEEHGIVPKTIVKGIRDIIEISESRKVARNADGRKLTKKEREQLIESLTKEMKAAAKILEFEAAAKLRDRIRQLREQEK